MALGPLLLAASCMHALSAIFQQQYIQHAGNEVGMQAEDRRVELG